MPNINILSQEMRVEFALLAYLGEHHNNIWAATRENLSSGGCEQHRRRPACASAQTDQRLCYSLIASTIWKLATGEISIFYLVSVAEETGLKPALSETPKTGFLATRPI